MTDKHTPGPWNIYNPQGLDDEPTVIVGEDGIPWVSASRTISKKDRCLAEVYMWTANGKGYPRVNNIPEMLANARLIAAAPELLEALDKISHSCPRASTDPFAERAIKLIKATATTVIAKATEQVK